MNFKNTDFHAPHYPRTKTTNVDVIKWGAENQKTIFFFFFINLLLNLLISFKRCPHTVLEPLASWLSPSSVKGSVPLWMVVGAIKEKSAGAVMNMS